MAKYSNNQQQPVPDPVYPKEKSEDYKLLGGINSKVSLYMNGPAEFRDLRNLNFVNTGALTKRPGTTLFGGATLQLTPGSTYTAVTSGYEFQKLSGQSFLIEAAASYLIINYGNTITPVAGYLGSSAIPCQAGNLFSAVTFVDRMFACNGSEFYRINLGFGFSGPGGISSALQAFQYSLPAPVSTIGLTGFAAGVSTVGLSGTYVFSWAYMNDRGYIGPPSPGVTLSVLGQSANFGVVYYLDNFGASFLSYYYGVTAVVLYRSTIDGTVLTQGGIGPFNQTSNITGIYDLGSSLTATAPVANSDFYLCNPAPLNTFPGIFNALGTSQPATPFAPRYLEIYNNQMFLAGFSTAPSTFYWSRIGEPEGIVASNNAQIRTNDGDIISGMKVYLGALLLTKRKSVHLLTGDNPSDFLLQQLSDQYGCLSHRAIVPWNNVIWFLDSKGIIQFDGANITCVSTAIEPIFLSMNIPAAYDRACGIHIKKYNEVWFAIPINGSTINNAIVVFDYVASAWTVYTGVNAQCLFNAFAGFPQLNAFAGNYTGGLVYFDSTLNSDNDQGITCSFDSLFFSPRGQSTQNQFRRFYLDVNPVLGFTQAIAMTFKTDFGSTVQFSSTMYQNPFQSRIDFGLSARSIQASMYHFSASLPLKINGFTIESRYQRGV